MPSVPRLVLIGDTLLTLYRNMLRIRRFRDECRAAVESGLLGVEDIPLAGLEAIAVGVGWHLGNDDLVLASSTPLAAALAKGVPPVELAAQWLRRATGCGGGTGGSRRFSAPQQGVLAAGGWERSTMLQAVGAAAGIQAVTPPTDEGRERVVVAFLGQGAGDDGVLVETLRTAAEWTLPLLLVLYVDESAPLGVLTAVAKSHRVAAVAADGAVIADTYAAAHEAMRRARAGEGSTLLLFHTPAARGELSAEHDPLVLLRDHLLDTDQLNEQELRALHAEVNAELKGAFERAKREPPFDVAKAARRLTSYVPQPGAAR